MSEWSKKDLQLSLIQRAVILGDRIDRVVEEIAKIESELDREKIFGKHNLETATQLLWLVRDRVSEEYRRRAEKLIGRPEGREE